MNVLFQAMADNYGWTIIAAVLMVWAICGTLENIFGKKRDKN